MSESIEPGALYVVGTPIGNLDDISLRAVRILAAVDLIAAEDTRTTGFLLTHLKIEKPLISFHSFNEKRRLPRLLEALEEGKAVAVVTDAGTPGISDPAYSIVHEAIGAGRRVIAIPGASAVLPALIMSGLPMDRFVFEGFLPVKKGRKTLFERLKQEERTIVVYESPYRVARTLEDILQYLGDRQVALVREITKKFEETIRGSAAEVLGRVTRKPVKGECVLVIAGALGIGTENGNRTP
jgi:16S rRNA (cytidine1402-2'-O)-methyltransferase